MWMILLQLNSSNHVITGRVLCMCLKEKHRIDTVDIEPAREQQFCLRQKTGIMKHYQQSCIILIPLLSF